MPRISVEYDLVNRAKSINSCVCCGMPFAECFGTGEINMLLLEYQESIRTNVNRNAVVYDSMQKAHLLHKLQRESGRNSIDREWVQAQNEMRIAEAGQSQYWDEPGLDLKFGKMFIGVMKTRSRRREEVAAQEAAEREQERAQNRGSERNQPEENEYEERDEDDDGREGIEAIDGWEEHLANSAILPIESMLRKLFTVLESDRNNNLYERFGKIEPADERNKIFDRIYDEIIPTCTRCNTLMTMNARTTELLMAMGALPENWYNSNLRSRSIKKRNYQYGKYIAKVHQHVDRALRNNFRQLFDPAVGGDNAIELDGLVLVIQAFFLAICANNHMVYFLLGGKSRDKIIEHEGFRYAGVQRVYCSFLMFILCVLRFPKSFQNTSFCEFHINYAEAMPLFQYRKWIHWFLGDSELHTFFHNNPVVTRDSAMLVAKCLSVALIDLMDDPELNPDITQIDDAVKMRLPTLWNICYIIMHNSEMLPNTYRQLRNNRHIAAKYLPGKYTVTFPPWTLQGIRERDIALASPSVDIESWINCFENRQTGKYFVLKRMLITAVFDMHEESALILLRALGGNRNANAPLHFRYVSFLKHYYEHLLKFSVDRNRSNSVDLHGNEQCTNIRLTTFNACKELSDLASVRNRVEIDNYYI